MDRVRVEGCSFSEKGKAMGVLTPSWQHQEAFGGLFQPRDQGT